MLKLTPKTAEELREKQDDTLQEEVMTVRYYNEYHYINYNQPSREDPDPEEDRVEEEPTYNSWYCADCGILYTTDDLINVKYGPLLPPDTEDGDAPTRTTQAYCFSTRQEPVLERDENGFPRQVLQDVTCDQPLQTNSPDYWVDNFNITEL